jgi:cysteine synthase A
MLQELAGFEHLSADNDQASSEQVSGFMAHLQTMSGTTADASCEPVVCTAGLPAICAIWMSLLQHGGADVLMASTAYGGSSQLTDIIAKLAPSQFAKSTFGTLSLFSNIF